ncbi:MAG: cyclic nucleotide-binding domain-containing protein [Desulfobulbaceae bacterium]|uniref:Cyclic nucleotide-binding domain-containing protein n=1 Tax=Candidatus Desulfobia pelagia TaxID=2841692 RepID=A0A8J6NEI2_9BACT|nr:cyclic nucleotide-binding domain-containing protein [Candidatus Desulfobia pelagia]
MSFIKAQFVITAANDCPMYSLGDEFGLAGLALTLPPDKPTCLFLAREITEILVTEKIDSIDKGKEKKEFNCSGCTGLIKFRFAEEKKYSTPQMRMLAAMESREQARSLGTLENMLNSFSFLKVLDEESLKVIIQFIVIKDFDVDDIIIQQGHPGKNLYMIVSGRVSVLDNDGDAIAFLGRGEIFGEMSLFSGKPVCATIKTVEPTKVVFLPGKDLKNILSKFPFLQMAVTQILVQRLGETNISQTDRISHGLTGSLAELQPPELFQMIHENSKTGRVSLSLNNGSAQVAFKGGEVVGAHFQGKQGREAFFDILRQKQGRFSFSANLSADEEQSSPIDGFMKLLMDGLRVIDEETP